MSTQTSQTTAVMNTYGRFPITLVSGKGSHVYAADGTKYLDFTAGIATCNLGHTPEAVKDALHKQIDTLWHVSNLYTIPAQNKLASLLTENLPLDQVFFCNSGAEANEAAIKLVKKYWSDHQEHSRNTIVTFTQSFHGRTGTTMAATGQEKIHQGFTPLTPGFHYAPFNDDKGLDVINKDTTAAVMLELIQGEGGVIPAQRAWIEKLQQTCKTNQVPILIDEVQSGAGRTGTFFAFEQYPISPDIVTSAKGLGSGFPIGAMLATNSFAAHFTPGSHGSTFGGNPLAATAAAETVSIIRDPEFLERVKQNSDILMKALQTLQTKSDLIKEVRGKGFLIGVELTVEAAELIRSLHTRQILTLPAGPNVLRLVPPLTVSEEDIQTFITGLTETINEIENGGNKS